MKILVLFMIPYLAIAGFIELDSQELYDYEHSSKASVGSVSKRSLQRRTSQQEILLGQLISEDNKLFEILERQEKNVILRKKNEKVVALKRVKGIVLNSILAMNVKPSKFIVRLGNDDDLLEGAEIRCLGYSFQKRVPAHCNLLVLNDEEYEVDIDIWDMDGAEGVIADYFYSGEEKAFLTSSLSAFLQGVLEVAKDRIQTPFGEVSRNNAKNKVMGGIMNTANNVKETIEESGEKNLTIAYVNSGKEVLIFFNKNLKLSKRSQDE
ncbi:MAG: hypothetical protein COW00_00115 [Bdellovibrio sp. CG12_big_fil_rev_8_21_14_0_65_39_13]|nr:MAG: hypothetical protein COW78_19980 [Bdellovibrio sp. CG22_combo_CG10-13_8_21_14_all_39_27]PIQ62887.1 MAG: hypothetical protein COW00_00115 [Bdellovibrio sp. CG12_big_fil_rev_8_21_14_0_65_39_13]PIR33242.1 MAG: hypothetical protein COV37_16850 [Bdellovibrio sp. CG11_big_fil_rev_8_21_14_0_20_39_38]PJB54008.1 MAG: hypothetical protein CO099_03920 [Bdellovibrio sp. CG_4_9_14_3_um_filter_39_7]